MAEVQTPAIYVTEDTTSVGLSLRANFSWTFVGNTVYSGCQWGVLVVLAKLGTPELMGQYALGVAIATPVMMLTSLQLRPVIASDVREEYRFGEYAGFRLMTTVVALLIILAITAVSRDTPGMMLLIFLVGLSLGVEVISDVYYARMQFLDRMDRIAISQIARAPLSLLAMGLGVYFTGQVVWGLAGMILVRSIVLLCYDVRARTQVFSWPQGDKTGQKRMIESVRGTLRLRWDPRKWNKILWLSLPLGVVALLTNLNTNIPRYFIQWSLGTHQLGIFAAIAFLMSAGNLLVGALATAVFGRLAKSYANGNRRDFVSVLLNLLGIATALGAGGILVAWVAGRELLTVLYRPEYAEQWRVLLWFMVVAWVGYMGQFLGYAMTSARYFVHQIPLFVVVAMVIAVSSYVLVPRMGLTGAVLANLIGAIIQLVGCVFILMAAMRAINTTPRDRRTRLEPF